MFLEAYKRAPRRIVLDLDATDDPLQGQQEGKGLRRLMALSGGPFPPRSLDLGSVAPNRAGCGLPGAEPGYGELGR